MNPLVAGFFVVLGVLSDVLVVRYYRAISERRAFLGSVYGVLIPLFTFLVIERALNTNQMGYFLAFVLGNGAGTYWQIKRA